MVVVILVGDAVVVVLVAIVVELVSGAIVEGSR